MKYCIDRGVEAYVRPNIGDFLIKGARSLQLDSLPVLLCHRSSPSIGYLAVKRLTDILLSLLALVVFSPFMLVTAIAIKAYDGGPVLYKQLRLTKDRKEFYVYKFRSMRVDAEKDGVARLAQTNDDRLGLEEQYMEILGVKIPMNTIPITPGRNLAVILEVAAINVRQRKLGYNAAQEFTDQINRHFAEMEGNRP